LMMCIFGLPIVLCRQIQPILATKITKIDQLKPTLASEQQQTFQLDASMMLNRFPAAVFSTLGLSCSSFVSTFFSMVPLAIIFHAVTGKEGIKVAMRKGIDMGSNWGQISAVFAGAEHFLTNITGSSSRWNTYVGSGIGTAYLNMKVKHSFITLLLDLIWFVCVGGTCRDG
jgi:hypothetical protein